MSDAIDPEVRRRAEAEIAARPNSCAAKAIRAILGKGQVTTADLVALGYDHAPRAIMDVKDAGLPVVTVMVKKPDGKRMASYRFGSIGGAKEGRSGGRKQIPKAFRAKILASYGSTESITGAKLDPHLLQVDHRVPYQIDGDRGLAEEDVSAFMLLDARSQRLKSWSCEQCPNFLRLKRPEICATCFWASPESYNHVATESIRRTDVVWQGEDVAVHDRLRRYAEQEGVAVAELLRRFARKV